jgi:hypothetical protein
MPKKADNFDSALTPALKITLLSLVELANTPLEDINLKDLCERHTPLLGTQFTARNPTCSLGLRRRAVQKYFTYLKTLTPQRYLAILSKFEITPSTGTVQRTKDGLSRQNLVNNSEPV